MLYHKSLKAQNLCDLLNLQVLIDKVIIVILVRMKRGALTNGLTKLLVRWGSRMSITLIIILSICHVGEHSCLGSRL